MKFVDEIKIKVASGKGGQGCVSFRREMYYPRGGPDGGDGGRGGDVIFKGNRRLHSLMDLRYKKKYSAGNGQQGSGSLCTGEDGKDLVIEVPVGTTVRDEANTVFLDIKTEEEYKILEGGRGGKGNHFFKSSINQAPEHSQPGESGQELDVNLELKLLADVGLVGSPNAGKSTFISVVSAAKPKIADYPFTTLVPNLGVVSLGPERSFVIADIPGLIKGASEGQGLGSQFLRHIERTKIFLHLVDLTDLNPKDPWEDYQEIRNELKLYDEKMKEKKDYVPLTRRPSIVALSKLDAVDEVKIEEVKQKFLKEGIEVWELSSISKKGLKEILNCLETHVFTEGEEA